MTDISFYHLLTTPLERALPKLMEKAITTGEPILIRVQDEEMMAQLNKALWEYEERSFLPHGSAADPQPEQQPIYITHSDENPNNATILVITDGTKMADFTAYEKVLDMFNGHDTTELTAARARWSEYKAMGLSLRYIQQQENGGWKEVA